MVFDAWNVVYRVSFRDCPEMDSDFDSKDEAMAYANEHLDKHPVVTGRELYVDDGGGIISDKEEEILFDSSESENESAELEEPIKSADDDIEAILNDWKSEIDDKFNEVNKSIGALDDKISDERADREKDVETVYDDFGSDLKDERMDREKDIKTVYDDVESAIGKPVETENKSDMTKQGEIIDTVNDNASDEVAEPEISEISDNEIDDSESADADKKDFEKEYPNLANALDLNFEEPEDWCDDCDDDFPSVDDEEDDSEIPAVSTDLVIKVPFEDQDVDDIVDDKVEVKIPVKDDYLDESADDIDDDDIVVLEEDTHPTEAQPEVDHTKAYNNALSIAKKNNKPVIYGYLGSDHHGSRRAYELSEPIICDDLEKCTKDAMSKYHPAGSLYVAYPDKQPLKEADAIDLSDISVDERKHLDIADKFRKKLGLDPVYTDDKIEEYYRHNQDEVEDNSTVRPSKDVPVKACKEYPLVTHDEDDMSDLELAKKLEEARLKKLDK